MGSTHSSRRSSTPPLGTSHRGSSTDSGTVTWRAFRPGVVSAARRTAAIWNAYGKKRARWDRNYSGHRVAGVVPEAGDQPLAADVPGGHAGAELLDCEPGRLALPSARVLSFC